MHEDLRVYMKNTTFQKWVKCLNKLFTGEKTQMANKHLRKCSSSLLGNTNEKYQITYSPTDLHKLNHGQ